jgi:hypothetical protein
MCITILDIQMYYTYFPTCRELLLMAYVLTILGKWEQEGNMLELCFRDIYVIAKKNNQAFSSQVSWESWLKKHIISNNCLEGWEIVAILLWETTLNL